MSIFRRDKMGQCNSICSWEAWRLTKRLSDAFCGTLANFLICERHGLETERGKTLGLVTVLQTFVKLSSSWPVPVKSNFN